MTKALHYTRTGRNFEDASIIITLDGHVTQTDMNLSTGETDTSAWKIEGKGLILGYRIGCFRKDLEAAGYTLS